MSNEIEQKGAKEVTTEHQTTPEEKAYARFLEEKWDVLSEAARTILREAELASYTDNLVHNVCFQPEEYEEAMEKMRLAATEITGRDLELLARLWRLVLAAAASIDPHDQTPAGHRVTLGDDHRYYRMLSGMVEEVVEDVVQEKRDAERREWIAQEELDLDDIPF